MTLHQLAEKLQQDLTFAAPELHTQKIADVLEGAVLREREACCAILASAEPNTRAEAVIEKISAVVGDCPPQVAGLISEWLEATADELADLQKVIRAGGAPIPAVTKIEIRPNGEWARFLFDEEGMISVCSSCGNYGFTFSAPGSKGLRAFLLDGGDDTRYFREKFEFQFRGKLTRNQDRDLTAFFKKIWPAFIEALRAAS